MKAQVMGSTSEELKIQVRIPVGNTYALHLARLG